MFDYKNMPYQKKEELIKNLRTYLQEIPEIVFAYIFGSFLEKMPYHDIDIALFVHKKKKIDDYDLKEQYADMLGTDFKEVFDIVIINDAPSSLLNSIFTEGRLIFCRDEALLSQWIEMCSLDMLANEDVSLESLREIVQ
ncbi:MAG: nucleotidyltransferase domain-containing protein [Thermodesulfobacteriota bacterium]